MVDVRSLKAEIIKAGKTQTEVAQEIGLSRKSWYDRLSKAKFDSEEMYKLIKVLNLNNDDLMPIFFADKVT